MKNFTNEKWNEVLKNKDWSEIYESNDLDNKVQTFTKLVTECLDVVAPFCAITSHKLKRNKYYYYCTPPLLQTWDFFI